MFQVFKILLSAITIVAAAEIAKRSTLWGALLITLPISSILSIVFLYIDTKDSTQTTNYAKEIFYLVPISLLFFVPFLFASKTGWPFWINFGCGIVLLTLAVLAVSALKQP